MDPRKEFPRPNSQIRNKDGRKCAPPLTYDPGPHPFRYLIGTCLSHSCLPPTPRLRVLRRYRWMVPLRGGQCPYLLQAEGLVLFGVLSVCGRPWDYIGGTRPFLDSLEWESLPSLDPGPRSGFADPSRCLDTISFHKRAARDQLGMAWCRVSSLTAAVSRTFKGGKFPMPRAKILAIAEGKNVE